MALKEGDIPEARALLEEVVRLDPRANLPRLKLIGLLILQNDLEGARRVFFQGELDPERLSTPLLRLYIFWAIQGGERTKALEGLRILGERKEAVLELILYAVLRQGGSFPREKLASFVEGSEEGKKFLPCLEGHLDLLNARGNPSPLLLRCFEENPRWLPAPYELAWKKVEEGKREEAELWYRRVLLLDPTLEFIGEHLKNLSEPPSRATEEVQYLGYLYLVDQLLRGNEPQIALNLLHDLPPPWNEHPRTLFVATLIREEIVPGYDSLSEYKRIYPRSPRELQRLIAFALVRNLREKEDEGWEEVLSREFPRWEKDPALSYAVARAKSEGEEDEGLARFMELAERFPTDPVILYDLGVLYEKKRMREKALALMERIIGLDPWHADALNFLGYSWAEQGVRLKEAHAYIEKALALKPYAGYIMDSMGWVLFQEGRASEAIPWLEKAVEREGPDPVILEHLGDAYAVTGNDEKAREAYRKALENLEEGKGEEEQRLLEKIRKTYDRKL